MVNVLKWMSLSSSIILLSGCFSSVKVGNQSTYMLTATPNHVPMSRQRAETLLVLTPETRPAYNTTQIAYTTEPYKIAYFAQSQWAETPGQMLQPLLVQTLQKTHRFKAVVGSPFIGPYSYVLNTKILRLEQDFTHRPTLLRLTARAQLTRATGEVIAVRNFTIVTPVRSCTPYSGIIAANRATADLLWQISAFTLKHA